MKKVKAIFFLFPAMGGSERVTIDIACALDRCKFDVSFVIVGASTGTVASFIPEGMRVSHIHLYNIWCFPVFKIWRFLKKEDPDIVFSSVMCLNARIILAARLHGKAKIIVRNDNMISYYARRVLLPAKIAYPKADLIIAQTEEMHSELSGFIPKCAGKIITLHNPMNMARIDAMLNGASSPFPSNGKRHIISVGSVCYSKGQDLLIEAFARLHEQQQDTDLYIIGPYDGNDNFYAGLKSLIQTYGLGDDVHFTGLLDNPYKWMHYCDCFVLPSRIEGLPNVLLEAMYCGASVVSTDCVPIVKRIVSSGHNGFIVPTGDASALYKSIIRALEFKDFSMTFKISSISDFTRLFEMELV